MRTARRVVIAMFAAIVLIAATPASLAQSRNVPGMPALFYARSTGVFDGRAAGMNIAFEAAGPKMHLPGAELSMHFVGGSGTPTIAGEEPTGGTVNVLHGGEPRTWHSGLAAYRAVSYRSIYPGIDARFGADSTLLKSEYLVAPHARPQQIRWRYEGATVSLQQRKLCITTAAGVMIEDAPYAYQHTTAGKRVIDASYRINSEDNSVSFHLGEYDPALPLVIDPTISFSSYVGGSGIDVITGMAADTAGNVYLAGYTDSTDFPVNGAIQTRGGNVDAFVVKMSATGDRIIYATYIGGVGDDRALSIAVDSSGRAVVAGYTTSANFPIVNAYQRSLVGGRDAFLLQLNATGSTLVFSTYFGGSGSDSANAVALDNAGNPYIAGDTTSANLKTQSAYQAASKGRQEAFAAKFTNAGALVYSTYLGGMGDDKANGIALQSTGSGTANMYVVGETSSPDFPASTGVQKTNGGGQDAFIAKIGDTGATLLYGSYLGGSGGVAGQPESAAAVALDSAGNAYVAGVTSSVNFPTHNAYQAAFGGGGTDAFLTEINAAGSAIVFSTYLGGIGGESAKAVSVEPAGTILVAGSTFSANFPTLNGSQATKSGLSDAFLTRFTATGADLFFSTYAGGAGSDSANAVASTPAGDVWIAGQTTSTDFPLSSPLQSFATAEGNGFVMKLGIANLRPSVVSVTPANGNGMQQMFQFVASDPNGGADVQQIVIVINSQFISQNSCYLYYFGSNAVAVASDDNNVWTTVDFGSTNTASNSACSINGIGASAVVSGNTITLTIAITFTQAFSGGKGVWVAAVDRGGLSSGWAQRASWGVFPGTLLPPTVSVTPSNGSGLNQTFQFVGDDANGWADLKSITIAINGTFDLRNACYINYVEGQNAFYLASDDTATWSTVPIGSSVVAQNSQCSLSAVGSSVTKSGTSIKLSLALTFKPAFAGGKGFWMSANDQEGLTSNWVQVGRWGVFTGAAVAPTHTISPPNGTGSRQMFQYVASDANGLGDLKQLTFIMNSTFASANSCYIVYIPGSNVVYLASDNNQVWYSVQLGTSQTAQNSACTLSGTGGSVLTNGNSLTLTLPLSFTPSFAGTRYIWIDTVDQENMATGWQKLAVFTVQ